MLPYLLSALYYLKIAKGNVFAIAGSIYGVWMIISAGIVQFLITSILYAPGIWVYMKGRKEKGLEPLATELLGFPKKYSNDTCGDGHRFDSSDVYWGNRPVLTTFSIGIVHNQAHLSQRCAFLVK